MTTFVRDGMLHANQVSEDVLERDIIDKVVRITEALKKAPFWLFFEKMKRKARSVKNMKYEVYETDLLDRKTTVTTGTTIASASNLVVGEVGLFVLGSVIFNASKKEYCRVTTAPSGSGGGTIVVTLMSGVAVNHSTGTATGVWEAADTLIHLGVTSTEGADDPSAIARQWDNRYNYCEIVDTQVSMSEISEESSQYGTKDRMRFEMKNALHEHLCSLETRMFFGTRDTNTISSKRWWTTGGMLDKNVGITATNVIDCSGGGFTKNSFEDFLETIYSVGGSMRKIAFCSPGGLVNLNRIYSADATLNINPGEKMIGTSIKTIIHSLGELELVPHYLFTPDRYGAQYGNMIMVVDPDFVGKTGFGKYGGIVHRKDRQGNNSNMKSNNIRTIFGVELSRPQAHGLFHNFA